MQKTIIILGGGTGGLVAANLLKKKAGELVNVILIDKKENYIYEPSFLWVLFGKREAEKIQRPLKTLRRKGIEFLNDEIIKIDTLNKKVKTRNNEFQYDYLIIALGAELAPEKIPGLSESGFNLYELEGIRKLRQALKIFEGGKVAILISSLPFKCPAAPYEAAFLLDEHLRNKGIREKTEISIFTPESLPMPSAGPEIGRILKTMVEKKGIIFNPELSLVSVDPNIKELKFQNGKKAGFDLLIFVPPHQGAKAVRDSALGNEAGWIPVEPKTLRTKYDKLFALGDGAFIILASGKPLPKAGVFAHFEAEVVTENIAREIKGLPADKEYDGRASCFLEIGFGKAGFASGNFYNEPLPAVKMYQPSRFWHWLKILFEKYWFWKWF